MGSNAGKSAEGAQERIGGGPLRDLFAADVLVSEGQAGMRQAGRFDVIQDRVGGGVDRVVSGWCC